MFSPLVYEQVASYWPIYLSYFPFEFALNLWLDYMHTQWMNENAVKHSVSWSSAYALTAYMYVCYLVCMHCVCVCDGICVYADIYIEKDKRKTTYLHMLCKIIYSTTYCLHSCAKINANDGAHIFLLPQLLVILTRRTRGGREGARRGLGLADLGEYKIDYKEQTLHKDLEG